MRPKEARIVALPALTPRVSPAPRVSRPRRPTLGRLAAILAAAAWLVAAGSVRAAGPSVSLLTASGVVDNVMSGYLTDGIAAAQRAGDAAVVIELDTPGGSLDSLRDIVTAMEESTIPVIVWVGPAGARAASAGTFLTLAANLAYMAPSTEIGAASPVDQNGNDITGTEGQKVKADAEAYITSIAELRGRNVQWAVSTVESAVSSPASEAVSVHAVDGMAATIQDVLAQANGKTVTVRAGQSVTLDLANAQVVQNPMNPIQDLLSLLSDPNIAFVLFTIGSYGLIFEVIHPNFATGIAGSLAIVLALIGFGSLPLNVGGLLLIILGIGLLVVDLHVTSHGLLTVGGVVSFVLGASALYAAPSSPTGADVSVAYPLIATMAIVSLAFMFLVLNTVIQHRRRLNLRLPVYGAGGTSRVPNGTPAEVRSPLGASGGTVFAAGEEWSARTASSVSPSAPVEPGALGSRGPDAAHEAAGPIPRGARVTVVGQQGLTLIVEPDRAAGPAS